MSGIVSSARSAALSRGASARPRPLPRALAPSAVAAAGRVFGASVLLGLLALISAAVAIARVFGTWRVATDSSSHVVSVLGQRVSYPAANVGGVIVMLLAGLGLAMAAAVAWHLSRELIADRRFRSSLRSRSPRRLHGAWVIEDDDPQAFCVGLLRPRVYLSTGALELLDEQALAAVLAHERHHVRQRDPLRLACARALASGLLFVPTLRRLVKRQLALAEIGADEAAIGTEGVDRSTLASALLSFSGATGEEIGIDPERVDHLLGERMAWGFPLLLCLATAVALGTLTALIVLVSRVAVGSATLALPLLSSQPCVVVLSLFPFGSLLAGAAYLRSRRSPAPEANADS
jgi:hypothetical protein